MAPVPAVSNNLIFETLQNVQAGLNELRAEMTELLQGQDELRSQVAVVAQGQNAIRNDVGQIKLHLREIAIIVDHHTRRLDKIEQHLRLEKAQH